MKNHETKAPDKKFQSFMETYPFCAFGLALGLIYPNNTNTRKRLVLAIIIILINGAELFWFIVYMHKCLKIHDVYNFTRNMSLATIIVLFFFKSFYAGSRTVEFGELLKKISDDLLAANNLGEEEQNIYRQYIKQGKIGEICWVIIPFIFCSQFPLYAAILTSYESLKSDVGKKYMLQEMDLKYLEDIQFESPYYEIIFAYNFIQCFVLVPNFVGFDGSFCIATTHLRLKLALMTHKLQKSFECARSISELRKNMKKAIQDHQEAIMFYKQIQAVYGPWLLAVFTLTSCLISCNLYQIYLIKRIDPRYTIFTVSGVLHMYAPCYSASMLLQMSENLCFDIYDVSWEHWSDSIVTKMMIFMIAKAQQPMYLDGYGLVTFNMQLFISILQTSYSVFALFIN